MAMENKRIIQLSTERLNLTSGDYVMVDSETDGSAKYRLDRLKETDTTLSVSGMAADAAATGQAISAEATARGNAVTAEAEARAAAITAEASARQSADTTLQGNITAEATARAAADTAIGEDIDDLKSATSELLEATAITDIIDFTPYISGLTSGIWRMEKTYPAGYVESIKGHIIDSSSQTVLLSFYDPTTYITMFQMSFTGIAGDFTLDIGVNFKSDFGIGIYCQKLGFKPGTTPAFRTAISSCPVGTNVAGTSGGNVDLAFYPVYKQIADRFSDSVKEQGTKDVILGVNLLSQFTTSILSGYWWTDFQYEAGYIDYIVAKAPTGGAGTKCSIVIIDATNNKVLFVAKNRIFGDDLLAVIPVHLYTENPVYIGATGVAYVSAGSTQQYVRNTDINPEINDTLTYSWTGTSTYKFALQITYGYLTAEQAKYCKIRRRMFICGDSITAGYPFNMNTIIDGVRYGDAIGRTLDYDVTFGAQSGNGWLYTTGSAYAYSITNSTDFSQFDVALYAWGTNDFYHDMELGDINDTYASQTVCGTMNYCIDKIYTDNPAIVLIISTPLNRTYSSGYGYNTQNAKGYTLLDMVNKMIELCKSRGIAYIDNTCSPFNPKSLSGITGDGLHPNRVGYEILGAYMSAKVSSLIMPFSSQSKGI